MRANHNKTLGNCYQASGSLFANTVLGVRHPLEALGVITLVHGRPTLTVHPYCKYGHAWLELGDAFCYDVEREMLVPKALFYEVGKVDPAECYRYNAKTFEEMITRYGHWGPWQGVEAEGVVEGGVSRR